MTACTLPSTPVEEWRPVPNWPQYQVSSLGRVVSLARTTLSSNACTVKIPRRDLSPYVTSEGCKVCMKVGVRKTTASVARLVLLAFTGEPPAWPKHEPIRLDGNRYNDRLDNLRWGTKRAGDRARMLQLMVLAGARGLSSAAAAEVCGIGMRTGQRLATALRRWLGCKARSSWSEVSEMVLENGVDLFDVVAACRAEVG